MIQAVYVHDASCCVRAFNLAALPLLRETPVLYEYATHEARKLPARIEGLHEAIAYGDTLCWI